MSLNAAGRRWAIAVASLIGLATTASLGAWQLRRADQKIAWQRTLADNAARPLLTASAWPVVRPGVPAATPWPIGRPVRLRGRWVPEQGVYLDNRQMHGRVGFYLVMPLRLEGRPDAVLVQRGWVPRDAADRTRLPSVVTPVGSVEVVGRMAPPPARLFEFVASTAGTIRQNLDPATFALETGLALQPGSVQQLDRSGAGREAGLTRDWPEPTVDVQKHYGYAFQWFAMCALMAGLYVWFQLVRPRLGWRDVA